ncbi:MAG: ABC transporter substrate-binding protein [Clostridiales bacterium]|jgi:peptide/nickel transport system substrate-binding protein|nr:ABC transporter substrate-binding protein [Clostridiales bacterium]
MKTKSLLALILAAATLFASAGCGVSEPPAVATNPPQASDSGSTSPAGENLPATVETPNDSVLVVGIEAAFEEKWNPFIVESAYDHEVIDRIFSPICELNARGELSPKAGSITAEEQDGTVLYTIKINEGMTFSDGTPVTIDDYIYGLYVRADPSFAGKPGSLLDSFIEGVENYFYDDPGYEAEIQRIEEEGSSKYSSANISFEDFLTYAEGTSLDGWWTGDPAGDVGNGSTWSQYAESEGFGEKLAAIDATNADQMFKLISEIEYTNYIDAYDTETWFVEKLKGDYASGNLEDGVDVPEITGIKKIDDLTCTVRTTKILIYSDRGLTVNQGSGNLIPKHYYGDYEKGDTSGILSNMIPLGSGPYIWAGFSDNIATATANVNYYEGVPKTGTVRWQYIPSADILTSLASGAIDIANPSGNVSNIQEMQSLGITYDLIDNAGYGYMGMNTARVPLDVRRGLWSLMNRGPSIEGYYGGDEIGLAHMIERPMTTTVAEYPLDATEYYPYSRDKAAEYFASAGYTQDASGKLVDSSGNQLVLNVYIGSEGTGDHPAYAMLIQAAEDLAALGGELQVQDVGFNILQGAMNDGTADAWVMAWGSVTDCDKSSQFRSTGGQNRYNFNDPKMDNLLDAISSEIDLEARRKLVSEMLDYAMDQAIEYPLYQRKNVIAYNTQNVVMSSIPESTSTFDYKNVLWQVEVLGA